MRRLTLLLVVGGLGLLGCSDDSNESGGGDADESMTDGGDAEGSAAGDGDASTVTCDAGDGGDTIVDVALTDATFRFEPDEATVAAGDAVTFRNSSGFDHSVWSAEGTGSDRPFMSENFADGESVTCSFPQSGTYAYVCGIHPGMRGVVAVGP